jgi:hypothetical protein
MRANGLHCALRPLSGRKDKLKFVYCFMILFLTIYIFKHFLLMVTCSHQGSSIMLSRVSKKEDVDDGARMHEYLFCTYCLG